MRDESVDLHELLAIMRRHWATIIFLPLSFGALAVLLAFQLPKRFKSSAVLSIQGSYFQNPLINDLIAQVQDPAELQSQRISLLRMSLTPIFLDKLGERYGIFTTSSADSKRLLERELFQKTIEYYSMGPTTFQISAAADTPEKAQQISTEVLGQMQRTLIAERRENLLRTRDAVREHVRNLGDSLRQVDNPGSIERLSEELEKTEVTLAGLLTKFSESHPDVIKLRSEEAAIRSRIQGISRKQGRARATDGIGGQFARQPTQEVFNELLKKLNYLTVVLEMEGANENVSYLGIVESPSLPIRPFFPDKRLFGAIGLGLGALAALLTIFFREVRRNSYVTPFEAAQLLETPLLGELPYLEPIEREIRMLPGPAQRKNAALPGPIGPVAER
jgi:uncharacterized protein involved in exopolysaccharide biosynthesis